MVGRRMRRGAFSFLMGRVKGRRRARWLCVLGMLLGMWLSGEAVTLPAWKGREMRTCASSFSRERVK